MRLIDADCFKQQIAAATLKSNVEPEKGIALIELVDAQPTAFDVNKVIERSHNNMYGAWTEGTYEQGINDMIEKAVDIVKCAENEDYAYQKNESKNKISFSGMELASIAIAIHKLREYKEIGTVEECRKAMDKQREKKPIRNDLCTCPECGTYNETVKKRRNTVKEDIVYCWHCGQAMEIRRD